MTWKRDFERQERELSASIREQGRLLGIAAADLKVHKERHARQQKEQMDIAQRSARLQMAVENPDKALSIVQQIDQNRNRRAKGKRGIEAGKAVGTCAVSTLLSA